VNKIIHTEAMLLPKCEIVVIDKGFVQPDLTINHHDMHDYLHLTTAGYQKAFGPIHELLLQLLAEGELEKDLPSSHSSE
jgi:platelet-activating factor acetylhydrolase IB subunit beta/gamma